MSGKNSPVIPFSPKVFTDMNRSEIQIHTIRALIGFIIFIGLGILSAIISQDSSLLIPWLCTQIIWLLLWYYDDSRQVRTSRFNGPRQLMHPDHLLIGTIPPIQFEQYDFLHSFLLMQNLTTSNCFLHSGFKLTATSVHIHPNFTDLLRRLYQLQQNIPLTVRVSLDGSQQPRDFSYHLLMIKRFDAPSRGKMLKFLQKCDEDLTLLQSIIESEFPHYRFESLSFEGLMSVVRGNTGQPSINEIQNFRFAWWAVMRSLISLFFISGLGIGLILYSFMPSILRNWLIGIYSGLFGALMFNELLKRTFLLRHHHRPFDLFSLFPLQSVLWDRGLHTTVIQDVESEQISIPYTFTLQTFHRAFRFQSIKFYRNLIYQLTHLNQTRVHRLSAAVEFRTRRIIPQHLARYRKGLRNEFWKVWERKEELHESLARGQAGFFSVQVVVRFTFHYAFDRPIRPVEMEHDLNTLLQILKSAFPQCMVSVHDEKFGFDYYLKNYHFARLIGSLPLHVFTGSGLVPFLQIPDEIHKSLPMHYAGEFSTPFLDDEIIFGDTLNPENMQLETRGGLTWEELEGHVLITGDDRKTVLQVHQIIAQEILHHNQPCIIFDRDGSWSKKMAGFLSIKIYRIGKNFGIHLFQLPSTLDGGILSAYQIRIGQILQNLFKWSYDQVSMLKALWRKCDTDLPSINAQTIMGNIEIKDSSRYRQQVFDFLSELGNQDMPKIFQRDLLSWIGLEILFDASNSMVIDLSSLKIPVYQDLFIHAFLTQLNILWENFSNLISSQSSESISTISTPPSKCIFIPQWDRFLPWVKKDSDIEGLFTTFTELSCKEFSFVGSTTRLLRIDGGILTEIKNYFAFRTQNPQDLHLLHSLLNIDKNYTNTFSQASRRISYQDKMLQSLESWDCVVYRARIRFPFVFRFDMLVSMREEIAVIPVLEENNLNQAENSHQSFETDQNNPPEKHQESESFTEPTFLAFDFADQPDLIPVLYNFLEHIDTVLDYYSVLAPANLLNELLERAADYLQEHQIIPTMQAEKCREWITKLERLGYIEQTTFAGGTGVDLTGYVTTAKTKRMLMQDNEGQIDQLTVNISDFSENQPSAPNDSDGDLPTHLPIYPQSVTTPIGDTLNSNPAETTILAQPSQLDEDFFTSAADISDSNRLFEMEGIFEKENRDNESYSNQYSESDSQDEKNQTCPKSPWKEELRHRLMDALIQARLAIMHGEIFQAIIYLYNELDKEIGQLGKYFDSEMIFQDCLDFSNRIKNQINKDNQVILGDVQVILDDFENFLISF